MNDQNSASWELSERDVQAELDQPLEILQAKLSSVIERQQRPAEQPWHRLLNYRQRVYEAAIARKQQG